MFKRWKSGDIPLAICWKWMQLTNLQENKYRTLNNGKVQVHCHETHKCLSKTLSRQSKTLVKGETHKMFSCCHCYYLDNLHHSHDHDTRSSVKIIAIENYRQAFAAVGDDPSISTSRQKWKWKWKEKIICKNNYHRHWKLSAGICCSWWRSVNFHQQTK